MPNSFPLGVSEMPFSFLTQDPVVVCEMSALCEPCWDVKVMTLDTADTPHLWPRLHENQQRLCVLDPPRPLPASWLIPFQGLCT